MAAVGQRRDTQLVHGALLFVALILRLGLPALIAPKHGLGQTQAGSRCAELGRNC